MKIARTLGKYLTLAVKVRLILLAIFMGFSSYSFAVIGTESSGGGGAAVCRDSNRQIVSARVLDLFEGELRFSYSIPQSDSNPRDQLVASLDKIQDQVVMQLLTQFASGIISNAEFLPQGVGMAPTTDLGNEYGVIVPDGCAVEPIGF